MYILEYVWVWRGGRVVEGAALEKQYAVYPYREFESLPLRQIIYEETTKQQPASIGHFGCFFIYFCIIFIYS